MILDISSYIGTALYRRLGSMSQPLIIIRDTIATLNGESCAMQLSQLYMFPLLAQQVRFDGMPSGPFILAGVILEDMVHLLE